MIVNAEIVDFPKRRAAPWGASSRSSGRPDDFGIDVEILIRAHHIPHQFPARRVRAGASDSGADSRRTRSPGAGIFAAYDIVTIDGETARDFDDAVWVERLPNGNCALHVHIADVSHYVRPGTPIDAKLFCAGRAFIFPIARCRCCRSSCRPISARCVRTKTAWCCRALLEIDNHGDVVAQEFTRGVIRSAERMTYTAVHGCSKAIRHCASVTRLWCRASR